MSIFILLLALAIWGIVHSLLASHLAKDLFNLKVGRMDFYRLAYNIFAGISFLPILYLMATLPNQPVYQISVPWSYFMLGGQLVSAIMLLAAFLQTDSLSFVGLRQLFEAEQSGALVTRGLYRIVRHPLYTFSLLFIWLSPSVSQNSLTVYIGATIYTLVGAYFEERKLSRDFGEAYTKYKQNTPMLIPNLSLERDQARKLDFCPTAKPVQNLCNLIEFESQMVAKSVSVKARILLWKFMQGKYGTTNSTQI